MNKAAGICFILLFILAGCASGPVTGSAYNFEHDNQYYYENGSVGFSTIAASTTGYYFFSGPNLSYLYYMDKSTMKPVLMCNKPDCLHTGETDPYAITDCNAFFHRTNGDLAYYDSSLYVVDTIDMSLYQVSLDATERKRLFAFKNEVYDMIVHRGYVYYAVNEGSYTNNAVSKTEIYRIGLNTAGKTPELLFSYEGYSPLAFNLKGYGDTVYFSFEYYTNSEMIDKELSIYKYDVLSNQCYKLIENAVSYMFYKDTILFSTPNSDPKFQLYTCKLDGAEIKKVDNAYGNPYGADEKHIYAFEIGKIFKLHIYDWSRKKVTTFDFPKCIMCGCDDKYFFVFEHFSANDFGLSWRLYALDKNRLSEGAATLDIVHEFVPSVESRAIITQQ